MFSYTHQLKAFFIQLSGDGKLYLEKQLTLRFLLVIWYRVTFKDFIRLIRLLRVRYKQLKSTLQHDELKSFLTQQNA